MANGCLRTKMVRKFTNPEHVALGCDAFLGTLSGI